MGDSTIRRATKDRHDQLVSLLRSGVDTVETLAERTGVSPSTVRRDLTLLQRTGRIARTYGGAIARETFHERSFGESAQVHQPAKAAIASVAVDLLPPGGSVFLDAGTTCLAVARLLTEREDRTVVTRGLEAALLLSRHEHLDVVMLGGQVRPLSHGVIGPLTSLAFERMTFDVAFLGADAVDPVHGLGEPTIQETFVKEQAADRAGAVVLLADSSKLRPTSVPAWVTPGAGWTFVTDAAAEPSALDALRANGVRVLLAEPADG